MNQEIALVLTGTIAPNTATNTMGSPKERREEYLAALHYYSEFGDVYFLENSTYDVRSDPEFDSVSRLHLRKFPPSRNPDRGKGYQEFEMLDTWMETEATPPRRWLKVTGRYIVRNISEILSECRRETGYGMIIDQKLRSQRAMTHVFYVESPFYQLHLRGVYMRCDDQSGRWIERILFNLLRSAPTRSFGVQPIIEATCGSTGAMWDAGAGISTVKQVLRTINQRLDRKYLWYA